MVELGQLLYEVYPMLDAEAHNRSIKAVDCESTTRGFNSRRSPMFQISKLQKDFFLVNVSQLTPIFFVFFFLRGRKKFYFSPIYYDDEQSNYHYIYSFFYFFFQVQDNPKGLWVFFYQLGLSLHHPHGDDRSN